MKDDCISRQAAHDFISAMNACNDISDEAYQELMVYFENMPPAQPGWIPCSECEKRCEKWEHSKI